MGGFGSGRRKDRERKTAESCRVLDVDRLSKKGGLRPGCSSVCRWAIGDELFSVRVRAETEQVHLSYAVRVEDGGLEEVVNTISIVRLRCRFGGSRAYFVCPGPQDGTDCGRRVSKLHLSHRYFLCRYCNKLAYACQYEQPWKRALRRANKLKQRLGINVGIAEPLPEKPKGMWSSTYGRLLDEILQAEILANEAKMGMFKRLLAQVKNDQY
jgi:hypothetical protein